MILGYHKAKKPGPLCPGSHKELPMTPHKWGACSPEPGIPLCSTCKRRHTLVVNRVKAAWRLKRVQTDGDMSVLLDAMTGAELSERASEIADKSEGRITVETPEQLRDGMIAVAWGTRIGDKHRGATREGASQYIGSSRVIAFRWNAGEWDAQKMGIGIDETEVPRELELEIEDMTIEFAGMVERVIIYGPRGNAELELNITNVVYPSVGMTFRAIIEEDGDFIRLSGRTTYSHPERLLGSIVRRESVINRRLGLVPCCTRDHDGDGRCDHHPDGVTITGRTVVGQAMREGFARSFAHGFNKYAGDSEPRSVVEYAGVQEFGVPTPPPFKKG